MLLMLLFFDHYLRRMMCTGTHEENDVHHVVPIEVHIR